ncbi:kinase-like protein [Xylaria castorea]|nr:kinase-like protein [Xylaria castorea]
MAPPSTRQLRKKRFQAPQKAWKNLRALLKSFEEEKYMKYNSVLGFGGFGLVLDWDILKPDGSRDRSIAMKTVVDKDHKSTVDSLKREIWWTKRFTGSEHLMQLVDLDERVTKAANINDENTIGIPNISMEKMGRGSLKLLMHRMKCSKAWNPTAPESSTRLMEYIPNRTLWHIFLCLTRAVIGMAYPANDPLSRKGHSIRETTQGLMAYYDAENLVHSDIDVGNVFIADPKDCPPDGEHRWAPVIKIADYGCMVDWVDDWSAEQKLKSLWGKDAYKAPEQFSPRCFDFNALSALTNVYQIGQMQRTVRGAEFRTYGWRVLPDPDYGIDDDWLNVDVELRELIVGCMADQASDRPGPRALEHMITTRIAALAKQAAEAAKPNLNPEASEFVPGQAPKMGLNPESKEFVPAQKPQRPPNIGNFYKNRVPSGQVEPDWLLDKFYNDYFVDIWNEHDMYKDHWSKKTLTPYVTPTT